MNIIERKRIIKEKTETTSYYWHETVWTTDPHTLNSFVLCKLLIFLMTTRLKTHMINIALQLFYSRSPPSQQHVFGRSSCPFPTCLLYILSPSLLSLSSNHIALNPHSSESSTQTCFLTTATSSPPIPTHHNSHLYIFVYIYLSLSKFLYHAPFSLRLSLSTIVSSFTMVEPTNTDLESATSGYAALPETPYTEENGRRRLPLKGFGIVLCGVAMVVLMGAAGVFVGRNGSLDSMGVPRGVREGVSEKSFRLFSGDRGEYPWSNSMLTWQRTSYHFQPEKNWMNGMPFSFNFILL